MSETRTTHEIECTKNPKWESGFSFNPELFNKAKREPTKEAVSFTHTVTSFSFADY